MRSGGPRSFGRVPLDELDREIRHHIEAKVDFLVEAGWDPDDARREAERAFGDARRVRHAMRRADRDERPGAGAWAILGLAASDVRRALRGTKNAPGLACTLIATLALGIGAASAIFAVIDALLVRPMPYREPERLVEVNRAREGGSYNAGLTSEASDGWRESAAPFSEGWVAWARQTMVRTDGERAEALSVLGVTPGADTLLGIPLLHGRAFTPEDAVPGAPDVAILGRGYFDRLGADPTIVGRSIRLESGPVTVVGVLRGGVQFPDYGGQTDLWLPMRTDYSVADRSGGGAQGVWTRLLPGIDLEQAQARADQIAARLAQARPLERGSWRIRLVSVGAHRQNADVRRALWILAATVGAIFLIALANGVNLLLVRTAARTRELAVRQAIGAARSHIVRQLLAEGLVLGFLGGGAAVALAWAATRAVGAILPSQIAFFAPHAIEVEARTLGFAFFASLVVGTTLGLVPTLGAFGAGAARALARRAADGGVRQRALRNALVVVQVALSMTLLAGAGLFVKSFAKLVAVDPGFDSERLALMMIGPSSTRYPTPEDRAQMLGRLEESLEAHPAVRGVTTEAGGGFSFGDPLQAEGEAPPDAQPTLIPFSSVAPDYFDVMGVEIVEGRGFTPADAGSDAVVVDRDLAHFLWGSARAVGRRFRIGDGEWKTVVGVARELRLIGRDQRQGPYQVLYPRSPDRVSGYVEVGVRTDGDPAALLPVIQETLRAIDPEQWIWKLRSASDALAEEEEHPRFLVSLMTLLAAVAVTLAGVGLYGVLAYSVTRRDRELGVRMALGAERGRVRGMVLREGLAVALAGIVLGVAGALLASRTIEQFLYDVEPRDPTTIGVTALLFLAIAAAASFVPARRATRVDPVEALRAE